MSVRNAGTTIKEARLKAGLTQEKLSENVCSVLSLSRIENGSCGVSPSTFQALMQHAGVSCETYPIFANRTDFDCFYALKQVQFFLNSHQLTLAYDELSRIESMHWADNRFYYQEWLYLYYKMLAYSGTCNHTQLYGTLLDAIHISRPDFDPENIRNSLLSIVEIRLFLAFAQEAFYQNELSLSLSVCSQISTYLAHSTFTTSELDQLRAEHAIVYGKYLLATKDFKTALSLLNPCRVQAAANLDDSLIHELTFLTALCHYHLGDKEQAALFIKAAFFSAHSIESTYATICRNYVNQHLEITLPVLFYELEDIALPDFPIKKVIDTSHMGNGIYDLFSPDVLTLGSLIRELRLEQHLSQTALCQGLCSKSKLSKIENGTLQPEIILAQCLLQRLGISERVFTFYGNAREAKLQELLGQLNKTYTSDKIHIFSYCNEIKQICSTKDTLYLQKADFFLSHCSSSPEEQLEDCLHAIHMTIPDFTFLNILNCHLSGDELCIVLCICNAEYTIDPNLGIQHLYRVLEYADSCNFNIMATRTFYPIVLGSLTVRLFAQERYREFLSLIPNLSLPVVRTSLYYVAHINLHYCQVLGLNNQLALCKKHAYYAYYNAIIMNINAFTNIRQGVLDDFNIEIL